METIRLVGYVDEQHQLFLAVPKSIQPGQVTVLLFSGSPDEDEAGAAWMNGIAAEWEDDLADPQQDLYSMSDGEPVRET